MATFTADSSADTETLFLLRLHNCGKVSGLDALDMVDKGKSDLAQEKGMAEGQDHLLKFLELWQAREQLHKAHHLWVLQLVVMQAAGRPRPNPSGGGGWALGSPRWWVTVL